MNRVTVIGTSHIAQNSVKAIKQSFLSTNPDIVAVELDHRRLTALLSNQQPSYNPKMIAQLGLFGYAFALIGGIIQRALGKIVNIKPGADMLTAAQLAKNNHKQLLLLDQDIAVTLRRLSRQITHKERWLIVSDLLFGWMSRKNRVRINLSEVPEQELITTLLEQLKNRYPTFHKVLLEERNHYMAKRLVNALQAHPDKSFLVVIGAGHLQGFREHVENLLNNQAQ